GTAGPLHPARRGVGTRLDLLAATAPKDHRQGHQPERERPVNAHHRRLRIILDHPLRDWPRELTRAAVLRRWFRRRLVIRRARTNLARQARRRSRTRSCKNRWLRFGPTLAKDVLS